MARVISVLNQKGGVGKTTSVYNIASAMALKGHKILMVDSDSQASLTLMTATDPLSVPKNLVSIYQGENIKNCIYKTKVDNLSMITSSLSLAKTETMLMSVAIGRENKIRKALSLIQNEYDYILIDCPPALGLLTINNLVASDYVIAPCETTALSSYALDDLNDTIEEIKEINANLRFLGVVATKFDKRIKKDNEILEELKQNYDVLGVLKNSVEARKGIEEGLPAVIFNKTSDIAKEYLEIANKIELNTRGGK